MAECNRGPFKAAAIPRAGDDEATFSQLIAIVRGSGGEVRARVCVFMPICACVCIRAFVVYRYLQVVSLSLLCLFKTSLLSVCCDESGFCAFSCLAVWV